MSDALWIGEVLEQVYEHFVQLVEDELVELVDPVHALIADDSDYHRTREGFLRFERTFLTTLGGVCWAVSHGTAVGSYPADPYAADICAFALPEELEGDERGEYLERAHRRSA